MIAVPYPKIEVIESKIVSFAHKPPRDSRFTSMICDGSQVRIFQDMGSHAWPYPRLFWDGKSVDTLEWASQMKACVEVFYDEIRNSPDSRIQYMLKTYDFLTQKGYLKTPMVEELEKSKEKESEEKILTR